MVGGAVAGTGLAKSPRNSERLRGYLKMLQSQTWITYHGIER